MAARYGWSKQYRRYAKSKAQYANEQFMELFDEDLVTLPEHLPEWFIDQRRMMVLSLACARFLFACCEMYLLRLCLYLTIPEAYVDSFWILEVELCSCSLTSFYPMSKILNMPTIFLTCLKFSIWLFSKLQVFDDLGRSVKLVKLLVWWFSEYSRSWLVRIWATI